MTPPRTSAPPPTVHRKHVGPRATMNKEELEQARKIVTYDKAAVANLSHGLAGEVIARDWVRAAYGGKAKLRAVMVRPGGVPVLDYLFETGNGEFVVVEAKAAQSQLGWTKGRVLMIDPGGASYFLDIPESVQQFSPTWFEQRLREMRGPKGDAASRRLAAELEASWRAGKIRPLVIRAPQGARTTEVAMEVLDYSDQWNAHIGARPIHTIPNGSEVGAVVNGAPVKPGATEQLPPAELRLKIHQADEARLEKEVDRLDTARAKADADLNRAKGRLKTAEKNEREALARKRTRQSTKDALAAKVKAEQAEVARLDPGAAEAKRAVDDARQKLAEIRQRVTEARAEVRRARAGAGAARAPTPGPDAARPGRTAEPPPSRPPAAPESGALKAGEAAEARATPARTADTAGDAAKVRAVDEGRAVRELATGSGIARAGRFARVLSLTKTIGKVAVGLFVPLTKLEILLELALWLYDWDQRRRQADEREWRRIYAFLFGDEAPIADPYAIHYQPAIGGWIWDTMNARLSNERDPASLTYWVREWDRNRQWLGFVYVGFSGDLIRQEHVPAQGAKAVPPIRYWTSGAPTLDFKRWSREGNRWKKEGPTAKLRPWEKDNLFTLGAFGDPMNKPENQDMTRWAAANAARADYLYRDVESRSVGVRVTSPTPILTPFDYLIFKCKDLMVETLRFIWKFDELFPVMAPFTREAFFTKYWYEGGKFPDPIDSDSAHYCLKKLHAIILALEEHTPRPKEAAQAGWDRRRRLIADLVRPNRTTNDLKDIAKRLHLLASNLNYSAYRPVQDTDLAYITNDYLSHLAEEILADARRILADMTAGKESARLLEYRYLGSKDA